jgi:anaerobic selenocysteine-containing dehydrogenase
MSTAIPLRATRERIKTTCPRDCYDACGIVAVREGGRLLKLLGDPDHPVARGALCGKCAIAYNGAWRDPALRLATPLKRIGPKGTASFAPISWDEALEIIRDRLVPLIDQGEASTVLHTHYTGTVGLVAGWYPIRFFKRIGATEVDPDTVCNKAGHVALEYVFGNSLDGFDPKTAKDAKTILVWGANPSHAAPHTNKRWLGTSSARVIVIDPVLHQTARQASLHLQVWPGTDAALAFGFMHVAKREGLLDYNFIARHVLGFAEIEEAIDRATPDWTEAATGVPAAMIEEVAIAYASGPSLLWMGQGMQRQPRGGNAFRALAALAAVTGNLMKPGAGFLYMNGPASRGIDMEILTAPHLERKDAPAAVSHVDLPEVLANPVRARMLFTWNNNIIASSPGQNALRSAVSREDLFHVAVDLFHTDTTAFADIVLPAASFLEFDDIVASYFDLTLSAQVKVMEPMGESLPNQEIFRRIATAVGLQEPELHESDDNLLARLLKGTPFSGSFEDLARIGTAALYQEPRMQFSEGRFSTPSGKIEIASERAEKAGLPRTPEAHADPRPGGERLRILSPASLWQMNSSYGNDSEILKKLGKPEVLLHRSDAEQRVIADGETVVLSTDAGRLSVTVRITDEVQPGMAVVYKGRWPGIDGSGVNINVLNPGLKTDIGESTAVHGVEAEISLTRVAK